MGESTYFMMKTKVLKIKLPNEGITNKKEWSKLFFDTLLIFYLFSHVALGWNVAYTKMRHGITLSFLLYSSSYYFIQILKKKNYKVEVDMQLIMSILFIMLFFASAFWSFNINTTLYSVFTYVLNFYIVFMVQSRMETTKDIDSIVYAIIIACLMSGLYVVYATPKTEGIARLGASEKFGNIITLLAVQSAFGFLLNLYYLVRLREKRRNWLLHVVIGSVFLYIVVRCGSKMGVILTIMGTTLFMFTYSKIKMRVFYIMLVPIAVIGLFYAVHKVEMLNVLFYKSFASLFNYLFKREGYIDISTSDRAGMIIEGLKLWIARPIFGWGAACFSKIASFDGMYSHNSYIEILSGLGFVGFILYYVYPIGNFVSLIKLKKKKNALNSLAFACISCLLFCHIGSVSYMAVFDLLLIFIVHKIVKKQKQIIHTMRYNEWY